jgi:hypothetical protein
MSTLQIAIISVSSIVGFFLIVYLYKQYNDFKRKQDKLNKWPPIYNVCPDYWADLGGGNCQNINNLGRCPKLDDGTMIPSGTQNFKEYGKIELPETQHKLCNYAKKCDITWEHIDKMC